MIAAATPASPEVLISRLESVAHPHDADVESVALNASPEAVPHSKCYIGLRSRNNVGWALIESGVCAVPESIKEDIKVQK
jgi:hypothetical protein